MKCNPFPFGSIVIVVGKEIIAIPQAEFLFAAGCLLELIGVAFVFFFITCSQCKWNSQHSVTNGFYEAD